MNNMATGANWAEDIKKVNKTEAERALTEIKKQREGKSFKLIKVLDRPATWKEVEIID